MEISLEGLSAASPFLCCVCRVLRSIRSNQPRSESPLFVQVVTKTVRNNGTFCARGARERSKGWTEKV
jgi:hypothetical protein